MIPEQRHSLHLKQTEIVHLQTHVGTQENKLTRENETASNDDNAQYPNIKFIKCLWKCNKNI